MRRLLLILFFFEIGFLLIVVPWSAFWDRNYFAQALPPLGMLITNNFVRGAVSGLGVVNVVAGLLELVAMVLARASDRPASIAPSQFAKD
jgi:hypothetical protein